MFAPIEIGDHPGFLPCWARINSVFGYKGSFQILESQKIQFVGDGTTSDRGPASIQLFGEVSTSDTGLALIQLYEDGFISERGLAVWSKNSF